MKRGKMKTAVVLRLYKTVSLSCCMLIIDVHLGTPTKNTNRMSPTLSGASGSTDSFSDRQFIAITSEKQARVVALPSQNCVYRQQIADTDYVVKAEIISLKGRIEGVNFFFHIYVADEEVSQALSTFR